jgi:hypothetical protein
MSIKEAKLSGSRHPYLVRAEQKELDRLVVQLWEAVGILCNRCTHARFNYTDWGKQFHTTQEFVRRLRLEMLNKSRYVDYKDRVDYVAGMTALDEGATGMEAANNRNDKVRKYDGSGGMASVADSYDWLHEQLLECKAKQKEYEEGWDAVRQFDTENPNTATAVRAQGLYHAFKRQILPSMPSILPSMPSIFKSKVDKTPKADMHAMRGLLAEMGGLSALGAVPRAV